MTSRALHRWKRSLPLALSIVAAFGMVALFATVVLVRVFLYEPYSMPAGSMIPTMLPGDRFYVDKRDVSIRDVHRGEMIVFRFPKDPSITYVKRAVGLAGDHIEIAGREVKVNGKALPRKPVTDLESFPSLVRWLDEKRRIFKETNDGAEYLIAFDDGAPGVPGGTYEVTDGALFVLGDNRDNSYDSRSWGLVPRDSVLGKPQLIWFSMDPETHAIRKERFGLRPR